ncbi:hypothetical protein L6R29_19255 [Myxococcota bacterium]|nr:hypothetical protein [Myxococcota bacterium]
MRFLLFFWAACFAMGCQPSPPDRYLPAGWSISPNTTQLLARSYPRFDWMTLILLPKSPPQHLFSAPLPPLFQLPPDEPHKEIPSFLPRFPWQSTPSPKTRTLQGFRIDFRSNQSIHLACRLQFLTPEKTLRTVESRFFLPASPRRWIRQHFVWTDFLPLPSQTTRSSENSFSASKARPSGTSQPTAKARLSGTSQPTAKARLSGTSQPTAKARLSGTSQPISKARLSGTSQPTSKLDPSETLQPTPRLYAIEKREAVFSAIDLRGGIAFWEISPRKRSVTLTLRGPFALSVAKRKPSLR